MSQTIAQNDAIAYAEACFARTMQTEFTDIWDKVNRPEWASDYDHAQHCHLELLGMDWRDLYEVEHHTGEYVEKYVPKVGKIETPIAYRSTLKKLPENGGVPRYCVQRKAMGRRTLNDASQLPGSAGSVERLEYYAMMADTAEELELPLESAELLGYYQ